MKNECYLVYLDIIVVYVYSILFDYFFGCFEFCNLLDILMICLFVL